VRNDQVLDRVLEVPTYLSDAQLAKTSRFSPVAESAALGLRRAAHRKSWPFGGNWLVALISHQGVEETESAGKVSELEARLTWTEGKNEPASSVSNLTQRTRRRPCRSACLGWSTLLCRSLQASVCALTMRTAQTFNGC